MSVSRRVSQNPGLPPPNQGLMGRWTGSRTGSTGLACRLHVQMHRGCAEWPASRYRQQLLAQRTLDQRSTALVQSTESVAQVKSNSTPGCAPVRDCQVWGTEASCHALKSAPAPWPCQSWLLTRCLHKSPPGGADAGPQRPCGASGMLLPSLQLSLHRIMPI